MPVREVCFIQSKVTYQMASVSLEQIAKKINDFLIARKVNGAFRLLSETASPRILQTYNETIGILKEKHLESAMKFEDVILHGPEKLFVVYSYQEIDSTLIYKIARETKGAAGQTDFNANGWLRIIIFSSLGSTAKTSVTH